ncbi:MAG TPA: MBL fold metallo-hydrolase [Prosthecobacter sp.]|nr:MBL fold metallo-hydrolase [Prosthecobacter sp.]
MAVHTLDLHFQGTPGIIAAYLVECGQRELALIETGPGSTLEALRQAITARGFSPASVRHVFVTHIHLDHAGAAGWFGQQGAQIFCHPNAQRHLVDPAKLIDSARLVYGAAMDTLWGAMLPAPAEKVTALQDGESVTIAGTQITAWDTPGHARHHHAYSIEDACFTGDVAGLRLENTPYISVTAAPPQFDPIAYTASVDRLLGAGFRKLHLTHFGEITDVSSHLTAYRDRISEVHLTIRDWVTAGHSPEEIRRLYHDAERRRATQAGVSGSLWQRYQLGNATAMCADGIRLHVEKAATA